MPFFAFLLALQAITPVPALAADASDDEYEYFMLYDEDEDGAVTKAELKAMNVDVDAEASKPPVMIAGKPTISEAAQFVAMDRDKDGRVTRTEFRAYEKANQ